MSQHETPIRRRRLFLMSALAAGLVAGFAILGPGGASAQAPAGTKGLLPGTAALSGTVQASKPFKAAQVYIHNVDKRVMYMVFTTGGQFRAVDLFPGNYEVHVEGTGLESDVQKLALKAGDSPRLTLAAHESSRNLLPITQGLGVPDANTPTSADRFESYEALYPPDPGRDVLERTCMICHGENFLPMQPARKEVWNTRIDHMMGPEVLTGQRPAATYAEGMLHYRDSRFRLDKADRDALLDYMAKYFGPDKQPRGVRIEPARAIPLDEAALGKAMYIEYYFADDPPGQLSKAADGRSRHGQDPRFDADGNVWMSDRGIPRRLIKLDPRTGEQKEWISPHPKIDVHEVMIGRDGMLWMPEHGTGLGVQNYMLGFNPRTEKWESQIDLDPNRMVRNPIKWMQSLAYDSKDNLYVGWIMGGALSKYEAATRKVSVFPLPTPGAIVYGVVADRNDFIYAVEWNGGKIARFDPGNESWTEFTPPTYPSHMRRGNVDYSNNYWVGLWAAGKRPGKLAKLDTATGRWTEFTIPTQNAQPYDVAADRENNIWSADVGYSATLWKFNTRDHSFTFYPKPQRESDSPKIQITKDGAIWYSPRMSREHPALGVLYPDMDKIPTLGAYYLNGPPGYPFKTGTSTARRSPAPAAPAASKGQ